MTATTKGWLRAATPRFLKPYWEKLEASPLGYRLARGVFWSMAGAMISRGLMLVATVAVARLLGKTVFGELGIIQATVGMFGVFAGFGLGVTATKHVAEFREKDPDRAGRIIAIGWLTAAVSGGIIALALVLFAPWLASETLNAPHLAGVLRISAIILFISAVNGTQTGALAGFEAFRTIARVNLFSGLLSFPMLISGAYYGGLVGTVWAMAINLGINWILSHLALRQEAARYDVPLTFRYWGQELPILWRFSLPAVLSGSMIGPVNWVIRALLTGQPDGYAQLGLLTAALVFQGTLLFVCGMLSQPLMSMLSNAGAQASERLGLANMLSSWMLGVGVAIPLLSFPEIAEWIFGADYAAHEFHVTFALVVFCSAIMTYKAGLARVLAARSLMWWGFLSNSIWAAILLMSAWFLVPLGARGLAASLTIAYVVNTLILLPLYSSRRLVPSGTLVSLEAILVWLVLLLCMAFVLLDLRVQWRAAAFAPSLLFVGICFRRIIQRTSIAFAIRR